MKKIQLALALVLGAFALNAQNEVEEGKKWLLEKENPNKAREVLQAALTKDPKNGEAYYWVGETYYTEQKWAEAKAQYDKAATAEKNAWFGLAGQGKSFLDAGNMKDAQKMFEKAIRGSRTKAYKEGHPDMYALVGDAYLSCQKPNNQEAVAKFTSARDIEPKRAKYWLYLGDAKLQANDAGGAMSAYETAADKQKDDPEVYLKMARIWARAQKYDLAVENADKGLKINENYAPLLKDLIEYLTSAGKYSRVTSVLEKYTAIAITDYDARARFVKYLTYQAKAYDRAVDEATKLLKEAPQYTNMYRWIAWARVRQGEQAEAEKKADDAKKYYSEALEAVKALFAATKEDQRAPYDYEHYAKSAQKLGDFDTAAKLYVEIAKMDTTKSQEELQKAALTKISNMYYESGQYAKSYRTLKDKFTKYGQVDNELYTYLICSYYGSFKNQDSLSRTSEKDIDEAADAFIKYNPSQPDGHYYKARAQAQMDASGSFAAKPYAEKAIELAKDDKRSSAKGILTWSYNYVATAYAAQGDMTKAKELVTAGLAVDPAHKALNKLKGDLDAAGGAPAPAPEVKN